MNTPLLPFIPLPEDLNFRNGGQQCDALNGPCACGAWHHIEDLTWRIFNQLEVSQLKPPYCLRSGCTTRAVSEGLCNYHFKKVQPVECKLYGCSAHGHAKECPEFAATQ